MLFEQGSACWKSITCASEPPYTLNWSISGSISYTRSSLSKQKRNTVAWQNLVSSTRTKWTLSRTSRDLTPPVLEPQRPFKPFPESLISAASAVCPGNSGPHPRAHRPRTSHGVRTRRGQSQPSTAASRSGGRKLKTCISELCTSHQFSSTPSLAVSDRERNIIN